MGKRAALHGFKSGILPTVRSSIKNPPIAKKVSRTGILREGYAPDVPHPHGSHREPLVKSYISAKDKLAQCARQPSNATEGRNAEEKWKIKMAELRRNYLTEALLEEERVYFGKKERRERRQIQNAAIREELFSHKPALPYTIPTVESIVEDHVITARNSKESELRELKKLRDRALRDLLNAEERAKTVVGLYQRSSNYITDINALESRINDVFADGNINQSFKRTNMAMLLREKEAGSLSPLFGELSFGDDLVSGSSKEDIEIVDRLLGTVAGGRPGLEEIDEILEAHSN
ncbi:uncharacterized protein V1510DRAFT_393253 [Dipodascopsis tothii]|uniref:uncharacterized protein n=1 Tax=Dipodascopsis tothii TaxID=44089 RepID=UPI0034CD2357